MKRAGENGKIFFITYLIALHLIAGYLVYDKISNFFRAPQSQTSEVVPLPTPLEIPNDAAEFPEKLPENSNAPAPPQANTNQANTANVANENKTSNSAPPANASIVIVPNSDKLLIPVAGVKKANLLDTYSDARSNNRVHNAIDIMAAQGTPVLAAADGEIAKFFDSQLGGITIYQRSKDGRYIYYYAHLQKRADNLRERQFVAQGTIIGYVGDTGNAGAGNFHLHFSVSIPADPKRYWEGENINPYPLLKDGIEAAAR